MGLWYIFLIDDWLWEDTLGGYKKADTESHVEEARKQHSSTAFALAPVSMFLPWFPSVMNCDVEG